MSAATADRRAYDRARYAARVGHPPRTLVRLPKASPEWFSRRRELARLRMARKRAAAIEARALLIAIVEGWKNGTKDKFWHIEEFNSIINRARKFLDGSKP